MTWQRESWHISVNGYLIWNIQLLEPILDLTFSDHSYSFRPGYNQRQAVEAAQRFVKSGKEYVVDIDLSKFFDRVNHDRLIYLLSLHIDDKRILRLIGTILRSGIMKVWYGDAQRGRYPSGKPFKWVNRNWCGKSSPFCQLFLVLQVVMPILNIDIFYPFYPC